MCSLILLWLVVAGVHSAVIHDHSHAAIYSQLQVQQQEPQQVLTPLKLQYVAPKAFLTSAGLVSGQQIFPTQNPHLIPATTIQPVTTGNPRHQSISSPQLISSVNTDLNQQQIVPSNVQQLNQQLLASNVELIRPRNSHNIQTTQQLLSVVNPQYLASSEGEITARNNQYLTPTNSPITPTANPQYVTATNAPVITSRNPHIFPTASQLVSADVPQQHTLPNHVIPLVYTIQSPVENYSGEQRYNRLPPTNTVIPELQFADPRSNGLIIPNAQIASLLNALYQPSYLVMTMPPTSYTAVNYYDETENTENQERNAIQSDSIQSQDPNQDHINDSNSNLVQRSSSDVDADSDSDFQEKQAKDTQSADAYKLSYKDNHVKYAY